jgi:hypothetical protein
MIQVEWEGGRKVMGKVKKGLAAAIVSLTLLVGGAMSASAAEIPCVAACAKAMGGQHVAACAQTMAKGASTCTADR